MMVAALYPSYSEFQRTAVLLLTMPDVSADAPYFQMPLYRPGTVVHYNGKRETIGYVMVRRSVLLVHLVGRDEPVDAYKLSLEPSRFALQRMKEKPEAFVSLTSPASATSASAKPLPRPAGFHALVPNPD